MPFQVHELLSLLGLKKFVYFRTYLNETSQIETTKSKTPLRRTDTLVIPA